MQHRIKRHIKLISTMLNVRDVMQRTDARLISPQNVTDEVAQRTTAEYRQQAALNLAEHRQWFLDHRDTATFEVIVLSPPITCRHVAGRS